MMAQTHLNLFIIVMFLIGLCVQSYVSGRTVGYIPTMDITEEVCRVVEDEAISLGLKFQRSLTLPIIRDVSNDPFLNQPDPLQQNFQTSWKSFSSSSIIQDHPSSPSDSTAKLKPTSASNQASLCAPRSATRLVTCCTQELELALLRQTMDEVQEGLSQYLARWVSEISTLRSARRDELFQTLELFGVELNKTLCGSDNRGQSSPPSNCSQLFVDILPKFRLMVEQFMIGQNDVTLDISIPIDNLVMQLLIDASCQMDSNSSGTTLEAFNEEIRCHKYCQARLNLILDSMMSNADHPLLTEPLDRYEFPVRRRRRRKSNRMDGISSDATDQYKLLYSPELLITIRLNRLLIHALEVAETLMEGLKYFNAAQGTCAYKLMRMHRCALCAGKTLTRPCPELCRSVLSSCLKPISQLDAPWKRFTETIKIVAQTFLQKPQLGLMVQFKLLPKRLIGYFRHLLKTHKHWLQPQCSGTTKLLRLFELGGPLNYEEEAPSSSEMNMLRSHQHLMTELEIKMEQMSAMWSKASSAVCSESPHLVSTSDSSKQCWNGTALASFSADECEFCDRSESVGPSRRSNPDFPETTERWSATYEMETPGRKQQALTDSHQQLSINPFVYNNLLRIPTTPLESATEQELATHRANELLVRASRDLQWSTESLLNELQTYYTIKHRLSQPASAAASGNSQEGSTESWVQLPETEFEKQEDTQYVALKPSDEMSNSLGMLAYGSMLGWNTYDAEQRKNPAVQPAQQTNVRGGAVQTMSRTEHDSPIENAPSPSGHYNPVLNVYANPNISSPLGTDEGSGLSLGWPVYNWPQPPFRVNETDQQPPVATYTETVNIPQDSKFEGSGLQVAQNGLQVDYADYPHLSTFHNFLNPNQIPSNMDSQGNHPIEGGLADDEDTVHPNKQHSSGSNQGITWMTKLNSSASGYDSPPESPNLGKEVVAKKDKGLGYQSRWTDHFYELISISFAVILFGYM